MITGVHTVAFAAQADEVRDFFRDVLDLPWVDAGGGWPIFALPPAELAVHPAEEASYELYLMCDDLDETMADLQRKGATLSGKVEEQPWGVLTSIILPGGGELGLYEPRHASPLDGVGPNEER